MLNTLQSNRGKIGVLVAFVLVSIGTPAASASSAKTRISFDSRCTNNRTGQIEIYQGVDENCDITFTITGPNKSSRIVRIGWIDDEDGEMYWDDEFGKSNKAGKGTIKNTFTWLMEEDGECYESGLFNYVILVEAKGKMKSTGGRFPVYFNANEDNCWGY